MDRHAGHLEDRAAAALSFVSVGNRVASRHFQPNVPAINIKRECSWLLSKHSSETRAYNDLLGSERAPPWGAGTSTLTLDQTPV